MNSSQQGKLTNDTIAHAIAYSFDFSKSDAIHQQEIKRLIIAALDTKDKLLAESEVRYADSGNLIMKQRAVIEDLQSRSDALEIENKRLRKEWNEFQEQVEKLNSALALFSSEDIEMAKKIVELKAEIDRLESHSCITATGELERLRPFEENYHKAIQKWNESEKSLHSKLGKIREALEAARYSVESDMVEAERVKDMEHLEVCQNRWSLVQQALQSLDEILDNP